MSAPASASSLNEGAMMPSETSPFRYSAVAASHSSESETFEENGLKFRYVDYVRK